MTEPDPQDLYDFIRNFKTWQGLMDYTQSKKTIQDVTQPQRTKEDNTVIQQCKPLKNKTVQYHTV